MTEAAHAARSTTRKAANRTARPRTTTATSTAKRRTSINDAAK